MDNKQYLKSIKCQKQEIQFYDIRKYADEGLGGIDRLPFSIRILVENLLRKFDGKIVTEKNLESIVKWQPTYSEPVEIPHHPARVLMQDFTGVPAVVDLAAMRDALKEQGGDPADINPLVPVELIVDHSVQIDYFGTAGCLTKNVDKEYERNGERYALFKWAQKSFKNLKVVPPNSGICHQVNLEHLGRVIMTEDQNGMECGIKSTESDTKAPLLAYPDSLVGLDSHTTMINSIGVMGWGVGGIEAEAVMLGQPYYMSIPEVIGVKLVGELPEGITSTDLVLRVTEILRKKKVVEKFVEFFGPGIKALTIPERATIANMAPEYGATMGFFPVDEETIAYLKMTDRKERAEIVESVAKAMGLFFEGHETPEYTDVVELDISTIKPAVAGPARPQDRIELTNLKSAFEEIVNCNTQRDAAVSDISTFHNESGSQTSRQHTCTIPEDGTFPVKLDNDIVHIGNGAVVIAAITSCTNTSNPYVLMGAGLLAKNALDRGLKVPSFVKTSLAPGSKVVLRYLESAGLMPYFSGLGFHLAAFGCATCIGNSGPLHPAIEQAIIDNDLTVASVLSGNRNFEARIHQQIKTNFLASPMLVVAFAIAGRIDIDMAQDPLAYDPNGDPVYLKDIWPENADISQLVHDHVKPEFYAEEYGRVYDGDAFWGALPDAESTTYPWDDASTYIKLPPYFDGFEVEAKTRNDIADARVLMLLGDSVTTDHISPAGAIALDYPAGQYLVENGVEQSAFNSYGSRRGNHEVMMRGTFGNIRVKNRLVTPKEGSFTLKFPEKTERFVYDACVAYKEEGRSLIVIGGKEYGTGSSRDWAAKGTNLLGVKAVIAESFERIHRSNLVGMGVLPLIFADGNNAESLGLDGTETYAIEGMGDMSPRAELSVKATREDQSEITFKVISRLDTDIDVAYFNNEGILPFVLRNILKG